MLDTFSKAAIRTVRPLDVAQYLRFSGWEETPRPASSDSQWRAWQRTIGDDEFEAIVPRATDRADYALRVAELIETIAVSEGREREQVFFDLLHVGSDVIRVRISDPDFEDGSLPIEEHAIVAQRTSDIVLAAACAAVSPKPVWRSRRPAEAVEQVRGIRIGQSEIGSYIVKVINRITPSLEPDSQETEEPFDRRVTTTLASALVALDNASERAAVYSEMDAFNRAVQSGVSANLCDAVSGLWGGDDSQRQLEFMFSWSPTRPVGATPIRRVGFGSDRARVIREAGRLLRERAPEEDFQVGGYVVKLDRAPDNESGSVVVACDIDGATRRISMVLSGNNYRAAIDAHRDTNLFRATGLLSKAGRTYSLELPHSITVESEQ
ncbi:hypothetical protein [Botrimarina mediterranea]|uniref:Uncharacterized protein n=1 Tax=Botrimarina mediterranea TaxID=2528022 RepID=A0A518KC57_9BACT|nr:hypothetical protein [Botrimarina mediterranea]QDV75381.1 hypothetical protein Spa11_35980 [Botrimarina mediterranea]